MSFSADVKEELAGCKGKSRHCQIAQLAGIFAFCGHVVSRNGKSVFRIQTENMAVVTSTVQLIEAAFGKDAISFSGEDCSKKGKVYIVECNNEQETIRILKAIKFLDESFNFMSGTGLVNNIVVQNTCCKRAFIRRRRHLLDADRLDGLLAQRGRPGRSPDVRLSGDLAAGAAQPDDASRGHSRHRRHHASRTHAPLGRIRHSGQPRLCRRAGGDIHRQTRRTEDFFGRTAQYIILRHVTE